MLKVHKSAFKHGISETRIRQAWSNFAKRRPRGDDVLVSVGFDAKGFPIELVALVLTDGTILVIHALSPPTEKLLRELGMKGGKQ